MGREGGICREGGRLQGLRVAGPLFLKSRESAHCCWPWRVARSASLEPGIFVVPGGWPHGEEDAGFSFEPSVLF